MSKNNIPIPPTEAQLQKLLAFREAYNKHEACDAVC